MLLWWYMTVKYLICVIITRSWHVNETPVWIQNTVVFVNTVIFDLSTNNNNHGDKNQVCKSRSETATAVKIFLYVYDPLNEASMYAPKHNMVLMLMRRGLPAAAEILRRVSRWRRSTIRRCRRASKITTKVENSRLTQLKFTRWRGAVMAGGSPLALLIRQPAFLSWRRTVWWVDVESPASMLALASIQWMNGFAGLTNMWV